MMNVMKKKTVNGFTLIEMIVVIAIIGILLGVLAPSMMSYYQSSRIKSANANAKMVYNAAQTEIIKYAAKDRCGNSASVSAFHNTSGYWISYEPGVGIKHTLTAVDSVPGSGSWLAVSPSSTNADDVNARSFVEKVNTLVSGANEVCWTVCVKNYIVQGCVTAESANSKYIGYYSANKQQASAPSDASYSTAGGSGGFGTLADIAHQYQPATTEATKSSPDGKS